MSQGNVKAFFEKIEADEDLSDRYKSLLMGMAGPDVDESATMAKVVQFASESGYVFTVEDLKLVAEERGAELSDEDLDAVAGGEWQKNPNYEDGLTWGIVAVSSHGGSGGLICVIAGYGWSY